jgi:hypothetical protein
MAEIVLRGELAKQLHIIAQCEARTVEAVIAAMIELYTNVPPPAPFSLRDMPADVLEMYLATLSFKNPKHARMIRDTMAELYRKAHFPDPDAV